MLPVLVNSLKLWEKYISNLRLKLLLYLLSMWFALLCFLHQLHAIFINWTLLLWAFGASNWINPQFTVTSYHQSTIFHHHHLLVLLLVLLLLFILVFMQYSNFFSFLIFWSCQAACETLVPLPGVKPTPSAVEEESLNHCNTREVPSTPFFLFFFYSSL